MNEDTVLMSDFVLELTEGFQEWLTFNISGGSANFNNGYFCLRGIFIMIKTTLDFVGYMRDNLYSIAAEISAAFLI